MNKTITLKSSKCKSLKGIIWVPGDKSISHRALILASNCMGNTKIYGLLESEDVFNTLAALKKLGIKIIKKPKYYEVYGSGGFFCEPSEKLDFGNSGTGLRLMIGLLSTRNINATFVGDKSLSKRPMSRIIEPLRTMNTKIEHNNGFLPINIKANQFFSVPIKYNLKIGSAQIKSALLLAGMVVKGTTEITENVFSRDHTERMLKFLGANIEIKKKSKKKIIKLCSPTLLKSNEIFVPGDISSAAFIIVAALLIEGSFIEIKGVGLNLLRIGFIDVLKKMKGKVFVKNKRIVNNEVIGDIEVRYSKLVSVNLNKSISARLIDEYPILFVAACFALGSSKFSGLEELKFKESDRLISMSKALKLAGVDLEVGKDSMYIKGNNSQKGGCLVDTFSDHRIAMSMLIFGLVSREPVIVDDIRMIDTSFPGFRNIMKKIGAKIEFIQK